MKKIKPQKVKEEVVAKKLTKIVFGFSKLQPLSYPNSTDVNFFINYLGRLKKLCELEWDVIWTTHKHGFGTETIPASSLKQSAQNLVPPKITKLLVLRATGDNRSFLGYRDDNVFQVIFIEANFGDIYH